MKTLGEQWIEEIDGVRHMVKVVKGDGITTCMGCFYFDNYDKDCKNPVGEAQCSEGIIKDFGPVNEDGVLGCPFCGKYPVLLRYKGMYYFKCISCRAITYYYNTKQEAVDACNRRAM